MSVLQETAEQRILIYTPYGRDAEHVHRVLQSERINGIKCAKLFDVIAELKRPDSNIGAVLTTEEALASEDSILLLRELAAQPTWSAIPVIAFYGQTTSMDSVQKKASNPVHSITDINFLQRPVSAMTLVAATRSAIRDRLRQYRTRDLLRQLEQSRTLAMDASQSKSQFLANMSHEIRTPLGAIMGFLDLMKGTQNLPDDLKHYISVIERNSVQLLRVIDDILDLSKVEAGMLMIEDVEVSLTDLLWDIFSLLGFKAREKGVLFDLHFPSPIPEKVISDPTRLRQILMNTVGNAIKFTKHGSVSLQTTYSSGKLCFIVTDSGKGISEEEQRSLFKPFSQGDVSTTRNFGGTGLGLVLTRTLCEQMGGSFTLESSEVGVGSVFKACVAVKPVAGANMIHGQNLVPKEKPQTSAFDTKILSGMHVLLVEDSPDNQALISILLKKLGVRIDVASNGHEGISFALKNNYDAVLMDIQMPFMDGYQATLALRTKGYETPIVALTAHAMKEERDRTLAAGFTDFLSKPIDRDHLIRVLSRFRPSLITSSEPKF